MPRSVKSFQPERFIPTPSTIRAAFRVVAITDSRIRGGTAGQFGSSPAEDTQLRLGRPPSLTHSAISLFRKRITGTSMCRPLLIVQVVVALLCSLRAAETRSRTALAAGASQARLFSLPICARKIGVIRGSAPVFDGSRTACVASSGDTYQENDCPRCFYQSKPGKLASARGANVVSGVTALG